MIVLSGGVALSQPDQGAKKDASGPSTVSSLRHRYGIASSHLPLYSPAVKQAELDATSGAGISWIRCVFAWSDMEPIPGVWNFTGTDEAVEMARARGIRILGILLASPPWANGGNPWNYPPVNMAAWYNYVYTVCFRYRGKVSAWEVWNEQNIHAFWMPDPNPVQYVNLLSVASSAVRAADPGAKVVMGGVAGLDPDFLNQCLAAGAANHIDALAYHPYPETLQADNYKPQEEHCRNIVIFLRWLISVYTSRPIEIWITEFGWTTCAESPPGVSEDTQASYILRSFLNYSKTDVNMIFLYNLRDGLLTPQHCYGILQNNFSVKPSYNFYKNFNSIFGDSIPAPPASAVFSCSAPDDLETHLSVLPDQSLVISAWNSQDNADVLTIDIADVRYDVPVTVNMNTGAETPTPGVMRGPDGRLRVSSLPIGKHPVVLRFRRLGAPNIFNLSPEISEPGGEVTLTGFGFGAVQGTSSVFFGSVRATEYVSWSDERIVVRVPSGLAGNYLVKVVTAQGESNSVPIKIFGISSIKPNSGVSGTVVTGVEITGGGFLPGAAPRIESGGHVIHARDVNVVSDVKITCTLNLSGAPLGRYDVVVRNPDGKETKLVQGFRVTNICGGGAAMSLSFFGMLFGLLSMAGISMRARKRKS